MSDVADVAQQPGAWLQDSALVPVWVAARGRLESNGVQPYGAVTVAGLDRDARHAVAGLLGRPVPRERTRIDLAALDVTLRERSGVGGLVAVLECLAGPVRNRAAERSSRAAGREAPYIQARAWLADRTDIATGGWVEEWLSGVRRSGVLSRLPSGQLAGETLVRALDLAAAMIGDEEPAAVSRTELAARSTGDAHGLDDGSVLAQLVLRALAVATEATPPATVAARRALWERHGVNADLVSSTCLVLGVRTQGASPMARRLRLAADAGDPVHLTAWDLARSTGEAWPGTWVLVCENPRVLEAVAQARGGAVAMVCTSGMPGLVALEVLRRLATSGAELAYHGDFDWPGVAIANRLVGLVGVYPWQMNAEDYTAAARPDGPALQGRPVLPVWDLGLGAVMTRKGVAVHEEAVLNDLLDRLPSP